MIPPLLSYMGELPVVFGVLERADLSIEPAHL
jgi:hypothetical protein